MSVTKYIAQHLIDVHEGNNWTEVNIKNALHNISVTEAENVTKLSANSIAALLHHITFYNEVTLERLNGINPVISDANGFDVPQLNTENAWEQMKQHNLQSAQNLAEAITKFPEDKLFLPLFEGYANAYKTLHGLIEHAHYHLGQIVLLKNFIKNGYNGK